MCLYDIKIAILLRGSYNIEIINENYILQTSNYLEKNTPKLDYRNISFV